MIWLILVAFFGVDDARSVSAELVYERPDVAQSQAGPKTQVPPYARAGAEIGWVLG